MKLLRKLKAFLFGKNKKAKNRGSFKSLVHFDHLVASPQDMLPALGVAIGLQTEAVMRLTTKDIRLYNIYSNDDNSYIGCCYVVELNGKYYGAMTGTNYIFSCDPHNYHFVKTNVVTIPLSKMDADKYFLICYMHKNLSLWAKSIKKVNTHDNFTRTIIEFGRDFSFNSAIVYCKEQGFLYK